MPEIEIHPVRFEDVDQLITLEHGYYSEYVWQMNLDISTKNAQAYFRRIRLPRKVFVPYPRKRDQIFIDYDQVEALLVAELDDQPAGYVKVQTENNKRVLKVVDLVISSPMRRKGIASGLLVAVMDIAIHRNFHTLMLEIQLKNDPAILMAAKLGFKFCGFRDHYFPNQDLALFFSRFTR